MVVVAEVAFHGGSNVAGFKLELLDGIVNMENGTNWGIRTGAAMATPAQGGGW
jgi:hypothetical protein